MRTDDFDRHIMEELSQICQRMRPSFMRGPHLFSWDFRPFGVS